MPHVYSDTRLAEISDNVTLETTETLNDSIGLRGYELNTLEYIAGLETKNGDKKVFEFSSNKPVYTYTGDNLTLKGDF